MSSGSEKFFVIPDSFMQIVNCRTFSLDANVHWRRYRRPNRDFLYPLRFASFMHTNDAVRPRA